jgi:hypothetical protein
MICARCLACIPDPSAALRLTGSPAAGGTGPRLLPSILCPDCSSQFARWMAGPLPVPADFDLPAGWPPVVAHSAPSPTE